MNLSKRSFVVIVPLMLVAFVLASTFVYFSLKRSTLDLETKRVELALTELAAHFNQYTGFAESYLESIVDSSTFHMFLSEQNNSLHEKVLVKSIENNMRNLKHHRSDFISFTVAVQRPSLGISEYIEISEDPFSEISEDLEKFAYSMFFKELPSDEIFIENKQQNLIVFAKLLDVYTLLPPLPSQKENSVSIQLAIEPSSFLSLRNELHTDTGLKVWFAGELPESNKNEKILSSKVFSGEYLITRITPEYFAQKTHPILMKLIGLSLFFWVLSSLLVYLSIRYYVTKPVSLLEYEISQVRQGEKHNIEVNEDATDEIGKIRRLFNGLYGELYESYEKAQRMAQCDALTGLYNLSYLTKIVDEAIISAKGDGSYLAFIYIDLDNFKFVNDKYGHDVGDALLKAFSVRLINGMRSDDRDGNDRQPKVTPARISGDEFAIVISCIYDKSIASSIGNRVLDLFRNGFSFKEGRYPVTASVGIAYFPDDGLSMTQLVSNADTAMYHAKTNGKNQTAFYSQNLADDLRRRKELETEIKKIDPDDEFYLTYMPIVKSTSQEIVGFEVLLRWNSKKFGEISPAEFIPIAEACGYFNVIDAWVFRRSIAQYNKIKKIVNRDFKLSINLSSAQIGLNTFGRDILTYCQQSNVPFKNIQIEVTETINADYFDRSESLLNLLADKGFEIAIDDFGTGYTSLMQMLEYPARIIKLDKTFMEAALNSNREVLKPLVDLFHSQSMCVTVEGVENAEQAEYLRAIDCDYLQGYYFGKPMILPELAPFVDSYIRPREVDSIHDSNVTSLLRNSEF